MFGKSPVNFANAYELVFVVLLYNCAVLFSPCARMLCGRSFHPQKKSCVFIKEIDTGIKLNIFIQLMIHKWAYYFLYFYSLKYIIF